MAVVFIRIDKIGDLISTLSVDQHPQLQEDVTWVISPGLGIIPERAVPPRVFTELKDYKELLALLRKIKPRAVVVFYAPWWVSLTCWMARVPLRVGRASQWHSFLFFNRRLRQTRSLSEKHENDYNRELVEFGLSLKTAKIPQLMLKAEPNPQLLEKHGLTSEEYFVVHPGMFGSALNWPQSKYNALIASLITSGKVAVTGTNNDERFLNEVKLRWANHPQVKILQGRLNMGELLSLLSTAKAVIAPSTGVLHMAAALGKKCVGIYSPILAHHPRRWGPLGPKASFLLPPDHQNMDLISVNSVLEELQRQP